MNTKSRIASILNADGLELSVTGLQPFFLSDLELQSDLEFQLPTNLRLGHLVEKIVSELIKSSANYRILYENIQLIEDKKTIGEIDYVVEEIHMKQLIHMELAYKFYLFDPAISSEPIKNWIGPNRNDSMREKLEKLKRQQFPLLYHNCAKSMFEDVDLNNVSQALCLLVSLFVPYEYKGHFDPAFEKAIKGYYLNLESFKSLDDPTKTYHIPSKKEWGMAPSENKMWTNYHGVEENVITSLKEEQSLLCWQKHKGSYSEFFIVWW